MIFWLYIDDYCPHSSLTGQCAILQHLTFNNTHLTPEDLSHSRRFIFETREIVPFFFGILGQIVVNMYGYLHDLYGSGARTFASIPKKDWCRFAFIANEYTVSKISSCKASSLSFRSLLQWTIYINCLRSWHQPITAVQQ